MWQLMDLYFTGIAKVAIYFVLAQRLQRWTCDQQVVVQILLGTKAA